jgi:hypothetical protein
MKKIIVFSQSPRDMASVLALYDKHQNSHSITIIVVNVKKTFHLLNELKLNAEIIFIPVVAHKHWVNFLKSIVHIRKMYRNIMQSIQGAEIYFFSVEYDYVTAFFIQRLQNKNKVYLIDLVSLDYEKIASIANSIKIFITRLIFGINIEFVRFFSSHQGYRYLHDKNLVKKIHIKVDNIAISKYKFKPLLSVNNKKKLLFIEQNGEISLDYKNYQRDLKCILDSLNQRYDVYIKPHPRLGYSSILDNYNVTILDAYYPIEIMNLTVFNVIVTAFSTSIASAKHPNKYCLIDLFEFTVGIEKINYLKRYLEGGAENEFHYISDIEELC